MKSESVERFNQALMRALRRRESLKYRIGSKAR